MNGLAVMNTRQATQANLCSILMFLGVLGNFDWEDRD